MQCHSSSNESSSYCHSIDEGSRYFTLWAQLLFNCPNMILHIICGNIQFRLISRKYNWYAVIIWSLVMQFMVAHCSKSSKFALILLILGIFILLSRFVWLVHHLVLILPGMFSKSPINQATARASLTQMLSIIFRQMENDAVCNIFLYKFFCIIPARVEWLYMMEHIHPFHSGISGIF